MPDSICPLPGSPARTSFYICLVPVCMIPRLRMWRAPPYPAGTGTSSPRMQGQAGADSLDLFELVTAFEEAYNVEIPSEDLEKLETVGDVMDYIRDKEIDA